MQRTLEVRCTCDHLGLTALAVVGAIGGQVCAATGAYRVEGGATCRYPGVCEPSCVWGRR